MVPVTGQPPLNGGSIKLSDQVPGQVSPQQYGSFQQGSYQSDGYAQQQGGQSNGGQLNWQARQTSGQRRHRRSLRHHEAIEIKIKSNVTSGTTLLKLSPMLSSLNGTFEYVIAKGNTSLFKVEQVQGLTYLHLREPLGRKGTFYLTIKGLLHSNEDDEKRKAVKEHRPPGYNEARKFALDIIMQAV